MVLEAARRGERRTKQRLRALELAVEMRERRLRKREFDGSDAVLAPDLERFTEQLARLFDAADERQAARALCELVGDLVRIVGGAHRIGPGHRDLAGTGQVTAKVAQE